MQINNFTFSNVTRRLLHKVHNMLFEEPLVLSPHLTTNRAHDILGPVCIELAPTRLLTNNVLAVCARHNSFAATHYLQAEFTPMAKDEHPLEVVFPHNFQWVEILQSLLLSVFDLLQDFLLS